MGSTSVTSRPSFFFRRHESERATGVFCGQEAGAEVGVSQELRDACERSQVLARFAFGSNDSKEMMDFLVVDGSELEAFGDQEKGSHWPVEVRQGGVRNGHPVPDASRMQSFAVTKDTLEVPLGDVAAAGQEAGKRQDRFAFVEGRATYERDAALGEHFGKAHGKP
jgi:hypothetical protein